MTTRSLIQWPLSVARLAKPKFISNIILLSGLFCLGLAAPAAAKGPVEIRVAIKRQAAQINIGSSVDAIVRNGAGKTVGEIKGMNGFVAVREGGRVALDKWKSGVISVQPKDANGVIWIGDRWYRGRVVIVPSGNGLTAVNWVDVEQYLYSVLGGEMSGSWHQEALKAQAVAARTYALYKQESSRNRLYDVVDTTASQVYRGIQDESTGTQLAVNATKGQVVTYNNRLILAAFHSSAGGKTDNVEEIWTRPLPYLRSVADFDQDAPVFRWNKTFSQSEISRLIGCKGGTVKAFQPVAKTAGERVKKMVVQTNKGNCVYKGRQIQQKLKLRSTKFAVRPVYKPIASANQKQPTKVIDRFEVVGSGFGHGLGLSQYGALGMAKKGYNYQQIVTHYYKNTRLSKVATPS
ncbi:SpoIID/LytB domain-containing protein [filamentous cyanobacterium LEGE 11480]|uniref:SpoIID/LytB domain-containing protein n=1 Tax=Romeriopsis navalis LEGE 11480 TaxID=2777977 RepID=A0A928VHT9_9CYAN|nr:SpoIID/LytB domain-containing protein [Romeriopsis navalis]MBE9028873.1 SpoIID/LytB domain-containing protein [Romeriopsis navalis LEGE 11480]